MTNIKKLLMETKNYIRNNQKICPISFFLVKKIFFTYSLIFLFITSVELIAEFKTEKNNIKYILDRLASGYSADISNALVKKDNILLKNIIYKISENAEITGIVLTDKNNTPQISWSSGKNSWVFDSAIIIRKIIYDNKTPVGSLTLSSDYSVIVYKLTRFYIKIFIMNLIIFLSLISVIYIYSKNHIVKPLLNFSEELRNLSSLEAMPMVSLDNIDVMEIHTLKNTTNLFIQEIFVLKESYKILIEDLMEKYEMSVEENHILEKEVKFKTKEAIEKEFKFQSIFEQSNVAIAIADLSGNIVECNRSYGKLLEYKDKTELIGLNFSEITHPEDIESQKSALEELFSGNDLNKRLEKRYITKNKNIIWADLTFTEIKNEDGKIINYVTIANDITKRKKYETELQKLYNLALDANALTGLPGNNTIRKHIEEAIEKNENLCLIYADLDNFKVYNDNYGFALGDKVITHTANIFQYIAEELKIENFFLGHIGGDDFVLLVSMDMAEEYTHLVLSDFEKSIRSFYKDEDFFAGYIKGHDRFGVLQKFPFISLSMAGLDLKRTSYSSYLEVNDALSAGKKQAKKIEGNSFYMEDSSKQIN